MVSKLTPKNLSKNIMRMKTYLLTILTLLGFSVGLAQKDTAQLKLPRFEVKVSLLGSSSFVVNPSSEYWDKATPGFTVPDSMNPNNYFSLFGNGRSPIALLSFTWINNSKKFQKFRSSTTFHFGIGPEINANKMWNITSSQTIDTLQSLQTGAIYTIEETKSRDVSKTLYSNSLVLGVGQRFSTNPHRLFKFETGIEALFVLGINGRVNVNYSESYYISNPSFNYSYNNTYTIIQHESYRVKSVSGMIVRVPLDFSFRLSNKRNVAKDMRIGFELNPGVNLLFQRDVSILNNYNISGGINFRYQF